MNKPKQLKHGDTIAIIAPSGGIGALVPHRLETAKKNLEELGLKVKFYPSTTLNTHGKAGSIQERVKDIHEAFKDPEVSAIICATGGLCANELLDHIDYNLIANHPKIFIGYSDITLLHYAFYTQSNLVTFYGPAAVSEFGEYPKVFPYTIESFVEVLMKGTAPLSIIASEHYTDELLDWFKKLDLTRPRTLQQHEGYTWIKKGTAQGTIVGGCISSLVKLADTKYDLDYTNKIFFIETPEGQEFGKGEPTDYVESHLVDLKNRGVFQKIKGLIVGRPYRYTPEEIQRFKDVLNAHLQEFNFPILFGADIGHTSPMITLPLGVQVTLNSEQNSFTIDESGISK